MGLTKYLIPILVSGIVIGAPRPPPDNSPDCTAKTIALILLSIVPPCLIIIIFICCCCPCCRERRKKQSASSEKTSVSSDQLKTEKEKLKVENDKLKVENEFLAARFHRDEVTLDPLTAHPRLEISTDGKSVQDRGKSGMVPESKKRFDSHTFTLAKEGFAEGLHYWEVDVDQKKTWDLGVASEHICRKGMITLSPLSGYWVIGADSEKDYWARTEEWTRLNIPDKLRKIGIFLDMRQGNLVFFNCNSKTKLHSFTLVNPGRLYPFFSTGSVREELDTAPLKIPPWN